jgi:TolB protein
MWFVADAFHFVWQKVTGDVSLSANISFVGSGGNEHRKAVLMVRLSLDADSAYADLALHGSGLTSLQYRDARGAATHEIQSNLSAPARLRIEKRGQYVDMWLAAAGEELHMGGGSTRVPLEGSFYLGIGVCAHDKDAVEKAVFSNVETGHGSACVQWEELHLLQFRTYGKYADLAHEARRQRTGADHV